MTRLALPTHGRSTKGVGNTPLATATQVLSDVAIPAQADWTSQGTALTPSAGEWDARFPHGTPGPITELDGTYYMYYIGADGDRSSDGGPAHRAVGVATASSLDGPWIKHASNPIIPWSDLNQNGDEEEGAWRLAGFVDDGTACLYVTVLDGSGGSVNGSIHLFTSSDGVAFTDQGVVLNHADGTFPGDDERGILSAFRADDDAYWLGYAAKGSSSDWDYTLVSGSARNTYTSGGKVLTSGQFGHGTEPILKSETEYLWFLGDNSGEFYAYTSSRNDPSNLSAVQQTYTGLVSDQFAVKLERSASTWYLFGAQGTQGDATGIELLTAPMTEV